MKKNKKDIFKFLIISLIMIMITGCSSDADHRTFYVSPDGNDENSGLSENEAWASIERVHQDTFQAGDAILFESGGIWQGQLQPKGSGETGKPITISSYGEGAMPVIDMNDAKGAAIQLINQSFWEIKGIEITSGAQPELGVHRQGIVAGAEGKGADVKHIVIRDCYIHDVWGQLGGGNGYSCAIMVGRRDTVAEINDVLIENNRIERVDKAGIFVFGGRENVVVRGNYMQNLGGDGIVVWGANKGLIEYNIADKTCLRTGDPDLDTGGEEWWPHTAAIWIIGCDETIMQFNEVYNTGRQPGNGDGFAYDFDFECRNCVLQYNYSANGHGLLLIMDRTYNNVARYNISQNDQTHLIQIHGNTEDGNIIHNNIFYVDHSTVDLDFYCGMENEKDKNKLGATFKNNIFYAGAQGRFRTVYTHGSSWDRQYNDSLMISSSQGGPVFQNNSYFGTWLNGLPEDPEKYVSDPLFVLPGSGKKGLSSLEGYKLRPGSPCIDAGIMAEMDTKNIQDFFGNPVQGGAIDIGVHEIQQ